MRFRALFLAALAAGGSLVAPFSSANAEVPFRTLAPARTFVSGILRVERFGAPGRPAVILIPGLYCGSWEWNGQIPLLAKTHAVYAVTLPGFDGLPGFEGPPEPAVGRLMQRADESLKRLITTEHLGKAIVIGHSLGGTLAVYFAENNPRLVRGVIAAEGGRPIAPTQIARDKAVAASVAPYLHISQAQFGPALRTAMLQYVITDKRDVDAVEHYAARSDPTYVVAWMRAALSRDLTPGLATMRAPFEEIIPFDSRIDPYQGFPTFAAKEAAYKAWVAHAPRGSVTMIHGSRHFVLFDRPAEFNRVLMHALAGM